MTDETDKASEASGQGISSDTEDLDQKIITRETAEVRVGEIRMIAIERELDTIKRKLDAFLLRAEIDSDKHSYWSDAAVKIAFITLLAIGTIMFSLIILYTS